MNIRQAITPLRLIFWGALLCVLDFSFTNSNSINGIASSGFRFDILNDLVGMVLITIGVRKLSKFKVDSAYQGQLLFILVCCFIGCIKAFFDHFIFPPSTIRSFIWSTTGIASLIATVLFANAMVSLAREHQMRRSELSWGKTRLLMLLLWCIPIGLINLAGIAALVTGNPFYLNIGFLIFPALLVMIVPLIHLFISTSRMRTEAARGGVAKGPPIGKSSATAV